MRQRLIIAQGADARLDPLNPITPALPHLEEEVEVVLFEGGSLRALMRDLRPGSDLMLFDMSDPSTAGWMRGGPRRVFAAVLLGTQRFDWQADEPKWTALVALDADVPGALFHAPRALPDALCSAPAASPNFSFAAVGRADFLYAALMARRLLGAEHQMLAIAPDAAEAARTEALLRCLGDDAKAEISVADNRPALARAAGRAQAVVDGSQADRQDWPGLSDACFVGLCNGAPSRSFDGPLEALPESIAAFLKASPPPDAARAAAFANGRNGGVFARILLQAAEAARVRSAAVEPLP